MSSHQNFSTRSSGTWTLEGALEQSQALAQLLQRLRQSQARLACIRELLPEPLRGVVRAGPLDEAGWSLLVPSGAVAAKLRQLMPDLQAALQHQGWPDLAIRIKVQSS
jgi:hypothetical protein